MASVPGDEESVARAVARHPSRIVGLLHARSDGAGCAGTRPNTPSTVSACARICLFPAMQRYSLHDTRVKEIVQIAAAHAGTAVFVHCGALSVGVERSWDCRAASTYATAIPSIFMRSPPTIPACRSSFRTSAPGCSAKRCSSPTSPQRLPRHVEHESVDVVSPRARRWRTCSGGRSKLPGRTALLFGTDSSFFPRGWNRAVYDAQVSALTPRA